MIGAPTAAIAKAKTLTDLVKAQAEHIKDQQTAMDMQAANLELQDAHLKAQSAKLDDMAYREAKLVHEFYKFLHVTETVEANLLGFGTHLTDPDILWGSEVRDSFGEISAARDAAKQMLKMLAVKDPGAHPSDVL